jgi:hypothetical protein
MRDRLPASRPNHASSEPVASRGSGVTSTGASPGNCAYRLQIQSRSRRRVACDRATTRSTNRCTSSRDLRGLASEAGALQSVAARRFRLASWRSRSSWRAPSRSRTRRPRASARSRAARQAALQTRWVASADGAGVNVWRHSAHRRRLIHRACDGPAHDSRRPGGSRSRR